MSDIIFNILAVIGLLFVLSVALIFIITFLYKRIEIINEAKSAIYELKKQKEREERAERKFYKEVDNLKQKARRVDDVHYDIQQIKKRLDKLEK